MQKIILALGDRGAEKYFEERQKGFRILGITTHRGGVYQQLAHHHPHVLVIRDNLPGKEDFLQLVFRIRGDFPDLLIIILAQGRQAGDPVLAALVNYGVHNILYGDSINLNRVIELFDQPMKYTDVQHLQPMAVLDEEADRVSVIQPPKKGASPSKFERTVNLPPADVTGPPLSVKHSPETVPELPIQALGLLAKLKKGLPVGGGKEQSVQEPIIPNPVQIFWQQNGEEDNRQASGGEVNRGAAVEEVEQPVKPQTKVKKAKAARRQKLTAKDGVVAAKTRQTVVASWGATRGVGSSTLALNLAVVMGEKGYHTLLLELDYELPAIGIWLSLADTDKGMETVLNKAASVEDTVLNCRSKPDALSGHGVRTLRRLPQGLDLMLFSQEYLIKCGTRSPSSYEDLRDLLTTLVFQYHYDVIIMDLAAGLDHPLITAGLQMCSHILCPVTEDIAVIAHTRLALEKLSGWSPEADKRLSVVYNRNAGGTALDLGELLGREAEYFVPETPLLTAAVTETGLPPVLDGRCLEYREAMSQIAGEINRQSVFNVSEDGPGILRRGGLIKKILGR